MSVTLIQDAQPGEDLIGIEPELSEQVDAGWLHRLALFNGRALTASALDSEQAYRAGRLAILGQAVTHGIIKGLALTANLSTANPTLQVTPGYGISASGEDVALLRTLRTTLNSLMVIDPLTGSVIAAFPEYAANAANTAYAGVLLMQPIVAQMSGASVDTGPVSQFVSGNLGASCDQDPAEYAFADWQIVDGVRLVLVAWPTSLGAPASASSPLGRNALAYTIFNAEMGLAPDDRLPWDMLGVPLALAGFSTTWQLQWVDCSSVVRTGGLSRNRYVLPATPGVASAFLLANPALAQARVAQLSEQLGALPGLTSFSQDFANLPPCGVLPASSLNFSTQTGLWFPSNWTLTVEPVYQEEVETALLAGMTAQPLDLTQPESIDILVPLPDALYDPNILLQETVAQSFYNAVDDAEDELTFVLQHRETIQEEANALSAAINGSQQPAPYNIDAGLTAVEVGLLGPTLPVGAHSITAAYTDTSNNLVATSAALTQTVSSVMLSASANPSVPAQAVTFTAALSNTSATGSVTFFDGATSLGSQALSGAVASISIASLSPGTHAITASYAGDSNNQSSVSPVLLQTVSPPSGSASLSLTSSANPAVAGQTVTLTAVFSPPLAGVNVVFFDDANSLGTIVSSASGVAQLNVASLAAGSHFITASFAGSGANPAVNSPAVVQNVSQAASTVTLSASVNPSVLGQGVTFTATVSPSSAAGSVQFLNAGAPLGAPIQLNGGVATLPVFECFGTQPVPGGGYVSQDYQQLITTANNSPYTIFTDGNGNPLPQPLPMFSTADLADMAQNGIQHFINRINANLSQANDLLDLAFLTTQSDIYRFRQYILGASDATALAVSPIAAQIATGESAAVTASNLQSYLSSILPVNAPVTSTTTTPPPTTTASPGAVRIGSVLLNTGVLKFQPSSTLTSQIEIKPVSSLNTGALDVLKTGVATLPAAGTAAVSVRATSAVEATAFQASAPGTVAQPATPTDIISQSPLVGAQLNLRTLTIAQRMDNPPSQEGLFYATGNRVALLQLLADLNITIEDLPILVDTPPVLSPPATTTTLASGAAPPSPPLPLLGDIQNAANRTLIFQAVLNPTITPATGTDPDEGDLFSTGIHVLEQHTSLLRAVEGRISLYSDFLTLCSTAITNVQNDLPQAQSRLTQLENDLAQARQDVAFTTALLADETARVQSVNAQRAFTLANYVPSVVYTRPRTLQTADASVPSRQLVPGNIKSPVPTCLQQSVTIPPELREIVSLLRDAPVTWMPSVEALLNKLERPSLLQDLGADLQVRATALLTQPPRTSSAASEPGVYAPVIANIYSADQQAVRSFQTARAAFQPAQLTSLSWASQITVLQGVASPGDLLSSDAVHAEVVNATSRLMQQISSVATCLYARACQALPADRLAWAEFLMGVGLSIQLQNLAVLPNWNSQDYVTRQQTQMLADWLFQQIDPTVPNAVSFMSDVVRVSILLASDAPVNAVIGGAVTLATTPTVGGIVSLTLPSDRVSQGMFVQLYSAGTLAAQAVVTDLDSASVRATVTQVYKPGVTLQANDLVHFTSQPPEATALRAFDT